MRNLSYENELCMQFHFHANQSHFHKNGSALRLALKQRHKGPQKWPISGRLTISFLGILWVKWNTCYLYLRKVAGNFQNSVWKGFKTISIQMHKQEQTFTSPTHPNIKTCSFWSRGVQHPTSLKIMTTGCYKTTQYHKIVALYRSVLFSKLDCWHGN